MLIQDQDLLESMQHATKSGFQDHTEAKISTSFMSELLVVFGKVTDGQESTFSLPAVKSFENWNPQNGVSTSKKWIEDFFFGKSSEEYLDWHMQHMHKIYALLVPYLTVVYI